MRKGEIIEFKPDKFPVGKYGEELKPFTLQKTDLQKGDIVYTFTDGFADQFGGPKGKKFKYKQLQELILSIHTLPMTQQKVKLNEVFEQWRGDLEQVDDVLFIGVKI
ncbi:MAG: PP2C family protein-serine/threonine phosphatase [Bacteroidia bacterium]